MPIREFLRPCLPIVALAAILACVLGAGPSRAEETQRRGPLPVEAVLAGVTSLSAQQMAAQTGEGLVVAVPKPALGRAPPPRVILWDEMHQTVTLPAASAQSVSVTVRVAP